MGKFFKKKRINEDILDDLREAKLRQAARLDRKKYRF